MLLPRGHASCFSQRQMNKQKAQAIVWKASEIACLMDEICALGTHDVLIDDLVSEAFPFNVSLDEVSNDVRAWRDAMIVKAQVSLTPTSRLHDPSVWSDTAGALLNQENARLELRIQSIQNRIAHGTASDDDRQALTVYTVLQSEIQRVAKEG